MTFARSIIWNKQKIWNTTNSNKGTITKYIHNHLNNKAMTTSEIIKTVAIYNRVLELLLVCKETNEANNYDSDNLFVECDEAGYYTNELGDIMPNCVLGNNTYYTCDNIAETAAKFTELCLKAGATVGDIYTSY